MAATLTATGTWTPIAPTRYVGGVGVTIGPTGTGTTNLDSRSGVQVGVGGFPELMNYLALMASNLSITADEALAYTMQQCADLRRQPQMGEHVYAP